VALWFKVEINKVEINKVEITANVSRSLCPCFPLSVCLFFCLPPPLSLSHLRRLALRLKVERCHLKVESCHLKVESCRGGEGLEETSIHRIGVFLIFISHSICLAIIRVSEYWVGIFGENASFTKNKRKKTHALLRLANVVSPFHSTRGFPSHHFDIPVATWGVLGTETGATRKELFAADLWNSIFHKRATARHTLQSPLSSPTLFSHQPSPRTPDFATCLRSRDCVGAYVLFTYMSSYVWALIYSLHTCDHMYVHINTYSNIQLPPTVYNSFWCQRCLATRLGHTLAQTRQYPTWGAAAANSKSQDWATNHHKTTSWD